jgi:hypothetical protein
MIHHIHDTSYIGYTHIAIAIAEEQFYTIVLPLPSPLARIVYRVYPYPTAASTYPDLDFM